MQSCFVSSRGTFRNFKNVSNDFDNVKFTSINVPMYLAKPIFKKALREEMGNEDLMHIRYKGDAHRKKQSEITITAFKLFKR